MIHDIAALETALASAVGADAALVAELRAAFLAGVRAHLQALVRAREAGEWRAAAARLEGLAASFGATGLMAAARAAGGADCGDRAAVRAVRSAVAAIV